MVCTAISSGLAGYSVDRFWCGALAALHSFVLSWLPMVMLSSILLDNMKSLTNISRTNSTHSTCFSNGDNFRLRFTLERSFDDASQMVQVAKEHRADMGHAIECATEKFRTARVALAIRGIYSLKNSATVINGITNWTRPHLSLIGSRSHDSSAKLVSPSDHT